MSNIKGLEDYNILIYGTGGNGRILFHKLIRDEFNVLGFIDKRAEEIGLLEGKKVYNPQTDLKFLKEKEKIVIIITIKNVFAHMKITKELFDIGFSHIIFKSLNVLHDVADKKEKEIDAIYETVVEARKTNEAIPFGIYVPELDKIEIKLKDRLYIKEKDDLVYAWCPVELLFNYKDAQLFAKVNMALFFPIVELYKAFLGNEAVCIKECLDNFYVYAGEWVVKNNEQYRDSLKKSLLESRYSVFKEMQKLFETQNDFFIDNAPHVERGDKNRFYMSSSGRNRVSFLIAKGYRYVPVKMNKKDYIGWCDLSHVEQFYNSFEKEYKDYFAPYPNPYLVDLNYEFIDYQKLFLQHIANDLTKKAYIDSVQEMNGIEVYTLQKSEEYWYRIGIKFMIDDGDIGREYFDRIGFSDSISDSNYSNILVFNDKYLYEAIDFLLHFGVSEVYVLTTNEKLIDNAMFTNGIWEKTNIFHSLCLNGILQGIHYTNREFKG